MQEIDEALTNLVVGETDIETLVVEYEEIVNLVCRKIFKISKSSHSINGRKTLPWWTGELTLRRKKTNALRRRYQRTKGNEQLREERRKRYVEGKKE